MPAVYDQIQLPNGATRYRRDKQFVAKDKVPSNVLEVVTLTNIVDENGTVIVEDKGDFGDGATPPANENADQNGSATPPDGSGSDPVDPNAPTPPGSTEDQAGTPQPQGTPAAHATANPPAAPPTNAPQNDATQSMDPPVSPDGFPGTPAALPSQPEGAAQAAADHPGRSFKSKTPQSEPGMDFPRKNGKTVDIFDGKTPHTHVRYVAGHMVPLTRDNYISRTDAEIEAKLSELGKELVDYNKYETGDANATGDGDDDGLSEDKA